ncbi:MAG: hypothetical protein B5M53_04280 [Candidatus Cloacimonas sp. 4484_209]|nr:MAG: hypothetical protein B5M53_04280 [Candidatus Cloacimonas sp. 4484_209]
MTNKIFLIDTNILVYAYDKSEKEKHEICKNLIIKCWNLNIEYAISLQNLSEFYVITTKKIENPLSIKNAKHIIRDIINFGGWRKINSSPNTVMSAIDITRRYKTHYWDSLLAATMRENNVFCIYTENEKDLRKIPWLEVINPMTSPQ